MDNLELLGTGYIAHVLRNTFHTVDGIFADYLHANEGDNCNLLNDSLFDYQMEYQAVMKQYGTNTGECTYNNPKRNNNHLFIYGSLHSTRWNQIRNINNLYGMKLLYMNQCDTVPEKSLKEYALDYKKQTVGQREIGSVYPASELECAISQFHTKLNDLYIKYGKERNIQNEIEYYESMMDMYEIDQCIIRFVKHKENMILDKCKTEILEMLYNVYIELFMRELNKQISIKQISCIDKVKSFIYNMIKFNINKLSFDNQYNYIYLGNGLEHMQHYKKSRLLHACCKSIEEGVFNIIKKLSDLPIYTSPIDVANIPTIPSMLHMYDPSKGLSNKLYDIRMFKKDFVDIQQSTTYLDLPDSLKAALQMPRLLGFKHKTLHDIFSNMPGIIKL